MLDAARSAQTNSSGNGRGTWLCSLCQLCIEVGSVVEGLLRTDSRRGQRRIKIGTANRFFLRYAFS
jgi:hypothetical protein